MKAKITYEDDSFVIEADSLYEIKKAAKEEIKNKGWDYEKCFGELIETKEN